MERHDAAAAGCSALFGHDQPVVAQLGVDLLPRSLPSKRKTTRTSTQCTTTASTASGRPQYVQSRGTAESTHPATISEPMDRSTISPISPYNVSSFRSPFFLI